MPHKKEKKKGKGASKKDRKVEKRTKPGRKEAHKKKEKFEIIKPARSDKLARMLVHGFPEMERVVERAQSFSIESESEEPLRADGYTFYNQTIKKMRVFVVGGGGKGSVAVLSGESTIGNKGGGGGASAKILLDEKFFTKTSPGTWYMTNALTGTGATLSTVRGATSTFSIYRTSVSNNFDSGNIEAKLVVQVYGGYGGDYPGDDNFGVPFGGQGGYINVTTSSPFAITPTPVVEEGSTVYYYQGTGFLVIGDVNDFDVTPRFGTAPQSSAATGSKQYCGGFPLLGGSGGWYYTDANGDLKVSQPTRGAGSAAALVGQTAIKGRPAIPGPTKMSLFKESIAGDDGQAEYTTIPAVKGGDGFVEIYTSP